MTITMKMKNSSEMIITDVTVEDVIALINNLTPSSHVAHITSAELPDYTVVESKRYDY